jgi:AcrR family transcriptional regulator
VTRTSVRRPRNRRELIIAAAAEQFRSSGYHNSAVSDIAEAVGITSAALYRHFHGKQDLLRAVVQDTIDRLPAAFDRDESDLLGQLRAACALTVHGPPTGVLWVREMAHLPVDVQRSLRKQVLGAVEPLRRAISRARGDLDDDDVGLLLWATLGVIASDAYHAVKIDPQLYMLRMLDGCSAVTEVSLPQVPEVAALPRQHDRATLLPASRQEALLTAAARLLATNGYQAVGVDDIGAEAGVTGPALYYHFENKAAILMASLQRCLQAMLFDLSAAIDSSKSPGEALNKLVGYFVRTCMEHGHVVVTLQREAVNLPADERRLVAQADQDYRDEWVALLVAHREDLSNPEAQVLVRAAIASISGILSIPQFQGRPNLGGELIQIGRAILGLASPAAD